LAYRSRGKRDDGVESSNEVWRMHAFGDHAKGSATNRG
jgi:hypothetical protein